MNSKESLSYLFDKYLRKECRPDEVKRLMHLLQKEKMQHQLTPQMKKVWNQLKEQQNSYPVDWDQMYDSITGVREKKKKLFFEKWLKPNWSVAATVTVLIVLGSGILWYKNNTSPTPQKMASFTPSKNIHPGGNKAVLTLSNGQKITLNKSIKGSIARQLGVQIIKADSGLLTYQKTEGVTTKSTRYNTLTTPRGGQYQLVLPDGTKVWLNAASSVRYPISFTGKERRVQITGEAYFEVTKNVRKPFIVEANNMRVTVLGTHFNINAYSGEASINTTLLEGSIKVKTASGKALVVVPGQQAQVNKVGELKLVKGADTEEAVAWKNGLFVFHNDKLISIMQRLSRWYDVQVEYKNNTIPVSHFTGTIRRKESLSKVLNMLELTGGAHFNIKEDKIIVSH